MKQTNGTAADKFKAMGEVVKMPGKAKAFYDDQIARGMGHNAILEQLIRMDDTAISEQEAAESRNAAMAAPPPAPRKWRWFDVGDTSMLGGFFPDTEKEPPKVEDFLSEFHDFARQPAYAQFRDAHEYTIFAGWQAFLFLRETLKGTGLEILLSNQYAPRKFALKVTRPK